MFSMGNNGIGSIKQGVRSEDMVEKGVWEGVTSIKDL